MLNKNVEKKLIEQIEKEGYSSNLYLAMASWAESNGFEGIAGWMYAQSDEERTHMLKIVKYVNERGGHALIGGLDEPPVDFSGIKALFEKVYEHEQMITASINDIVDVCLTEKDFTTHSWLQWFVNEQIEEEASVSAILDKLKLLGDQNNNLYLFDRDILGMRNQGSENQ